MTLAEKKNGREESCASELAAPTSFPYHKVGAASSLAQLSSLPFLFSARVIRLSRSQKSVLNFFRRRRPPISLDWSWPALQFDASSRTRGAILIELQCGGGEDEEGVRALHFF